jgi:phage terminase small subunit
VADPASVAGSSDNGAVPLNAKQKAFAREYLVDHNATKAAIRAGYSKKTAGSQGFDLLKKPEIAAAVAQGDLEAARKVGLTLERLDQELARVCFSDLRQAYKDGRMLPVDELPEDLARAVAGAEEDPVSLSAGEGEDGEEQLVTELRRKLKLLPKTEALALAYKRLGAFKDKDDEGDDKRPINIQIRVGKKGEGEP